MDILLIKGADVMMGIDQAEYLTVPLRKGTCLVENMEGRTQEVPTLTGAFKPTPEELKKLNEGASLHINVLGLNWAPMKMVVQDPPLPGHEPDDAEFDQGAKGEAGPLEPGQMVLGTEGGVVTVVDRADPCTLRVGDEVLRIDRTVIHGLTAALARISGLLQQGVGVAQFDIVRGGHLYDVRVALDCSEANLNTASDIPAIDHGFIEHTDETAFTG